MTDRPVECVECGAMLSEGEDDEVREPLAVECPYTVQDKDGPEECENG